MSSVDKKVWSTPKLRVFVRTRSEEKVLAGCKHAPPGGGGGLEHNAAGCNYNASQCPQCNELTVS